MNAIGLGGGGEGDSRGKTVSSGVGGGDWWWVPVYLYRKSKCNRLKFEFQTGIVQCIGYSIAEFLG